MRPWSAHTELVKDGVHDSRREEDFPIRNGQRSALDNRVVERFDQILHAGLHMEVPRQKRLCIRDDVFQVLRCEHYRGNELLRVALEPGAAKPDECLLILVKNEAVLRTVDTKLVKRGTHLRRKGEVRGVLVVVGDNHPQLVDNVGFAHAFQEGTDDAMRDYSGRVGGQVLRDPGNPVADDIVQESARQPANPMSLVGEERRGVSGAPKLVAVVALHVYRAGTQKAGLDQRSHASRSVPELIVVPDGDLQRALVPERQQAAGLLFVDRERLLDIDVASPLEAELRDVEMSIGRRRDVNDIGSSFGEELCQVAKMALDGEPLVELPRHQGFTVADADDFAFLDP